MLYRKKELGEKAHRLLKDEVFKESIDNLKQKYLDSLVETKRLDVEGREYLYKSVRLIDEIIYHLGLILEDGKIAAKEIEYLKKGGRK